MFFGGVSTCISGLVSMSTIHRQLGHSLLWVQFLTFTFVFGVVRLDCTKMVSSKFTAKRKADSENRQFKEEWTKKFAFILPPTSTRPMCLICQETIAVMKISNLKFPQNSEVRTTKINALKLSYQAASRILFTSAECSQRVVWILAKHKKPFSNAQVIK